MAPPLPSSALTETPSCSIHTCNQTMLLVVCPKSTWLHSHGNPFHIQSCKVICTPRHFFLLQTTIICFKSKKQFLPSRCYSEDALGYKAGRDENTKEGPLRECDETHSRDVFANNSLLYFIYLFPLEKALCSRLQIP